ncbi:LacI family DNA-binding transcriptional regulator [Wenxinia saemankumensis]|uniref:Transcriptional regulator, LacI family n=1 Tax=Wenxinia saemankumensis TaxID=1447782 RepID=A0A1M6FL55_9RHOB|nr:LacI family DNA-binding transcriptional regulator [Wenxinia saemankumensis]SHI98362.1 transcriptional regulator, LacI family [Wenxinia saemankumensis]
MTVPPRRPLTLRDVSEASGVSEMTVSRVLRDKGDVSEATRARVKAAAKRLGYVPNRIAGSLASSRVNLVAVVIPSLKNMVFPEVLSGISETLAGTGLQPVVGVTDYLPEREEEVLFEMLSWRPSGVIVAGLEHSEASRAMLVRAGCPVVEIMDTDGDPIDACVGISHRRAGRTMAEAILEQGYRRIGFLGTKMPLDHRARKRFEGFTATLARAGIEIADREFYSGGSALAKGREMTRTLMARSPDLDFLYYSNDMIGAGGVLELAAQGVEVPGRVGLAGFNGVELLDGLPRQLATMDACRREIGQRAAAIVAGRVTDPDLARAATEELTPRLAWGDTLRRR